MSFDPTEDNEEELFPTSEARDDATDNEEEIAEKASQAARKLEPIVLAHVLGPKYQPVKPRVIAKQLKLSSEQHKALQLAIRRLVKAGKLVYGSGHIVRAPRAPQQQSRAAAKGDHTGRLTPPARQESGPPQRAFPTARDQEPDEPIRNPQSAIRTPKNLVTGTFRRTLKGFGFVRPEGASRGDKAGDIYIAAPATMDAADRDVVRVRLSKGQARNKAGLVRLAGEIVEIVER